MPTRQELFTSPPEALVRTPTHRVVARLAGPDEAVAALDALSAAGVPREEVFVLWGSDGVLRLDPTGRHHGLRGRMVRALETITSAGDAIEEDASHVEQGGVVVTAPAHDDAQRHAVVHALRGSGATGVRSFGATTFEELA